jgi:hypothetical protein
VRAEVEWQLDIANRAARHFVIGMVPGSKNNGNALNV